MVIMNDAFCELSLHLIIDIFTVTCKKKVIENYSFSSIRNADQSGYTYEYVSKSTLDFQGSKNVAAAVKIKYKITHSYTNQLIINTSTKLIEPLILIIQEQKDKFGLKIQQKLGRNVLWQCCYKVLEIKKEH